MGGAPAPISGSPYRPTCLGRCQRHGLDALEATASRPGAGRGGRPLVGRSGTVGRAGFPSYVPGGRYRTCCARPMASIVSSTLNRTVVSTGLSAPPEASARATAAMDTLSGASQRVYPSCGPKAYQNPWSFPPTDSMYS